MQLAGKRAFITGAGGALGRASSVLFAREGAAVAVVDIDLAAAEETARLVHDNGGRAVAIAADVRDEAQVSSAVEEAISSTTRASCRTRMPLSSTATSTSGT
jgi:NAD(P)-dependent dehydrogenase (short-subunit alcohol dehydrogenase family)